MRGFCNSLLRQVRIPIHRLSLSLSLSLSGKYNDHLSPSTFPCFTNIYILYRLVKYVDRDR